MKHFNRPGLIVLGVLVVGLLLIKALVPMYVIGSGSMQPTLPVGTVVLLGSADELAPTDVITFQQAGDDAPTTHTFIGYAEDGSLRTKGDANRTPDVHYSPLTEHDVIGKVVYAIFLPRLLAALILFSVGCWLLSGRPKKDTKQSTCDTEDSAATPA